MRLPRNLTLAAVAVLLVAVTWRWRKPFSVAAAAVGLAGVLALSGAGYLGGNLVYRHGLGIPTEVLHELMEERGGPEPAAATDSTGSPTKTHTHSTGAQHEH